MGANKAAGAALCWLLCAPLWAQNDASFPAAKPSPETLLNDWTKTRNAVKARLRSYQVDGEYQEHGDRNSFLTPSVVKVDIHYGPVYRWRAFRRGSAFHWDTTNGAFEWNPRADLESQRSALSFTGAEYRRLTKNLPSPQTKMRLALGGKVEFDPPRGTILSLDYHKNNLPTLVEPLTLEQIVQGENAAPARAEKDTSPLEDALRKFLPFPFEPLDLVQDAFNRPDGAGGTGNLLAEYEKRKRHLSVHGPESVEKRSCWRLDLPPRFAQSRFWLPASIWFTREQNGFVPVRFFGTSESLPGGRREVERVVTIKRSDRFHDAWWPTEIEAATRFMRPGQTEFRSTSWDRKTITVRRINNDFGPGELAVQMPKYADVVRNGVALPREPIPEPPRLWWMGALAGAAIVAGGVTTGIVLRRRRSARLGTL